MNKLKFTIIQEGLEFDMVINKTASSKEEILKQIRGRLSHLMLLRKTTGANLGLSLSKPLGFIFKVGSKTVNTLTIAERLNITLKIGNQNKRREKFFRVVDALTDFMLRGDKAYTNAEIENIEAEIDAMMAQEAEVRLSKSVAEQPVSAN